MDRVGVLVLRDGVAIRIADPSVRDFECNRLVTTVRTRLVMETHVTVPTLAIIPPIEPKSPPIPCAPTWSAGDQ